MLKTSATSGGLRPSFSLVQFFLLQFSVQGGLWSFTQRPDLEEVTREFRTLKEQDRRREGESSAIPARTRVLRKMIQGFDFVLQQIPHTSAACKQAREELEGARLV